MRRQVWAAVGGFPEHLRSAEDLLFMQSIETGGFRELRAPDAIVHWHIKRTLWGTFKRFVTYARNNIRAGLWRQWQAAIFLRYALLAVITLPVIFFGARWLTVPLVCWLGLLIARGIKALSKNRRVYPAGIGRNLMRLLMLLPIIASLDLGGFCRQPELAVAGSASPDRNGKVIMALSNRRVLYISYNGMLDPLGQSQVIPYLKELSRAGVQFTLLSFERDHAFTPEGVAQCSALQQELAKSEIDWHWLRYHKTPSLPATGYDVWAGTRYAGRLVRDNRIEMVHARSHIPAAIALRLKRRFGVKMIFDVRGLMAEEYADAGHWRKDSIPYRITKALEGRALAAADGVVTLTERIWPVIMAGGAQPRGKTMKCPRCTDLEVFRYSEEDRARVRTELDLQDRFVLVYSGSVGGWYLADKMADLFVELIKMKPNSHFLWLTGDRGKLVEELMSRSRIKPSNSVFAV